MEGLDDSFTLLGNLFYTVPVVLEVGGFGIPVIDFIQDGIKRHDPLYEQGGDSGSKEAYEDIVVHNTSTSDIALECRDVTLQGQGELPIFLSHLLSGESRDGIPGSVLVLESCLELP